MTDAKVVEVPDWLAVGSEVAEIRGAFISTITFTTVQRHTATRVVLENGHWYRKQNGDRWTRSEGGTWGYTLSLVAPDHERAKAVLNQQRVDQANGSVVGAYIGWRRELTQGAGANSCSRGRVLAARSDHAGEPAMTAVQPRERAVPCGWCWSRTRRTTWNTSAVCDDCTPLATLVERPTNIVETVWGPKLPADSCTPPPPRWSDLFGIDPNFTTAATTEAETEAAYARWCRDHTGMTA